jgi:negative regulator of flagellin synthesis FlgM
MTNPITQWTRMASPTAVERKTTAERTARSDTLSEDVPAKAASVAQADQLQLSEVARQATREPEFDRAKVEAIKQAVQNGQYPLDARRMAESFVALEQMISE